MHLDRDELTLLALGEQRPEAAAHLSGCAECRTELAALSSVARSVRAAGEVEPGSLPEGLWDRIAVEAGVDPGHPATARPTSPDSPGSARSSEPGVAGRRWSTPVLAAAAVVGLVAGALVGGLWPAGEEQDTLLVSAELADPDSDGGPTRATAQVVDRDGLRVLVLESDAVPDPGDGYLEVWLLNPDVTGLVTLGPLEEQRQEFVLPVGLDLASFPVVDVSLEHFDGDPSHGGDSLWRGTFDLG